jgi:predicted LPLAT superfamily acyltransferase
MSMKLMDAATTPSPTSERRTHPRIEVRRPAKVYHPVSRKFHPCTAVNVSQNGAMLHLPFRLPVASGERLMLGVQTGRQGVLLRATEMMEVEVIRALSTTDGQQAIGVRFVHADDVGLNIAKLAA